MTSRARGSASFSALERNLLLGSVVLITLFAFESLATVTVIPTVLSDLGGADWLPLASGAALATQVVTSAAAGPLVNWRGPRPILITGVTLFALGLLVAGFAPHILVFVGGRALQGLGGGLAIVPLYVLVGSVAKPANRAKFFAAFSMAWVLPSLVGPPIAGYVVEWVGWRPIFWAVPVLVAAASFSLIPLLTGLENKPGYVDARLARQSLVAMLVGAALLGAQFSSSVHGWKALALLAVTLTVALVGLAKLLPRGTFRLQVGIPSLVAARGLTIAAQVSASSLIPMVLQALHGFSPGQAALVVGAGSVSWSVGSAVQARVVRGRERLVQAGSALLAIGIGSLVVLPSPGAWWPVGIVGVLLAGLGIGLVNATISDLTLGRLPQRDHAEASAALQVADTAGPALALALVSVAFVVTELMGTAPWVAAFAVSFSVALLSVLAAFRIGSSENPDLPVEG